MSKQNHAIGFAKYKQVRERILEMVCSMSPGERLLPECKLGADFDIARETLRRGLDDLARDGYLDRRLGAGTFVAKPKITKQFRVASFTEDMRQRGLVPSSRIVVSAMAKAGAQLGSFLKISPAKDVITIRRLRPADGLPMAIETLSTPGDLVPGLEGAELENRSFYEILAFRYGRFVVGAHQTIEATMTDEEASALLEGPISVQPCCSSAPAGRPTSGSSSMCARSIVVTVIKSRSRVSASRRRRHGVDGS